MDLGCHYYVLSLGAHKSTLFEAFRDHLIDVRNQGFPVTAPHGPARAGTPTDLARTIDGCLARHYGPAPLGIVVVGGRTLSEAFAAVTIHGPAIIGRVPGDHTGTSRRDLGQIAWPVVKAAMSRAAERTLRTLEDAAATGGAVRGLEAVAGHLRAGPCSTLVVEEDFHLRGSLDLTGRAAAITPQVDVRDVLDDVVDAVIERALAVGGRVVFTPDGSLAAWDGIALLPGRKKTP